MESHLSVGISHLEKGWQFHNSQNYFTLVFTTGYAISIHPEGARIDSLTRFYQLKIWQHPVSAVLENSRT